MLAAFLFPARGVSGPTLQGEGHRRGVERPRRGEEGEVREEGREGQGPKAPQLLGTITKLKKLKSISLIQTDLDLQIKWIFDRFS